MEKQNGQKYTLNIIKSTDTSESNLLHYKSFKRYVNALLKNQIQMKRFGIYIKIRQKSLALKTTPNISSSDISNSRFIGIILLLTLISGFKEKLFKKYLNALE